MSKLDHEKRAKADKIKKGYEMDDEPEIGSYADQKRWHESHPPRERKSDTPSYKQLDPKIVRPSKIVVKTTKPYKQYSIHERYEIHDRIKHPEFGKGIVTSVEDSTKIQVRFRHSTKRLMMNKKAA